MKTNDLLTENPFYILQATPGTDDKELLQKASEQYLLTGRDVKDEVNTLLQPAGRLRAELSFLPGMKEDEIEEIRRFLQAPMEAPASSYSGASVSAPSSRAALKSDNTASPPSLENAGALARLNGIFSMLEKWPVMDCTGTFALCLSVTDAFNAVVPEDVYRELAADRQKAGKSMAETLPEITQRLSEHKKALLSHIGDRSASLPDKELQLLLQKLADTFADKNSPYYLSLCISELVRVYLSPQQKYRIQEQKKCIMEILQKFKTDSSLLSSDSRGLRKKNITELNNLLAIWHRLSFPERTILLAEGIHPEYVRDMFREVNNLFVSLVNDLKDYGSASLLMEKMLAVFRDIPESDRKILEKNAIVVHIKPPLL